jgi:hypothetical protein
MEAEMTKLQDLFTETCVCGATYDQHNRATRYRTSRSCPGQYGYYTPDARTQAMLQVQAEMKAKAHASEVAKWKAFYTKLANDVQAAEDKS